MGRVIVGCLSRCVCCGLYALVRPGTALTSPDGARPSTAPRKASGSRARGRRGRQTFDQGSTPSLGFPRASCACDRESLGDPPSPHERFRSRPNSKTSGGGRTGRTTSVSSCNRFGLPPLSFGSLMPSSLQTNKPPSNGGSSEAISPRRRLAFFVCILLLEERAARSSPPSRACCAPKRWDPPRATRRRPAPRPRSPRPPSRSRQRTPPRPRGRGNHHASSSFPQSRSKSRLRTRSAEVPLA